MMIMNFFYLNSYFKKKGYNIKQIPMIIFGRSHGGSKMLMKHIFKSVSTMFLFYFKSKII